MNKSDIDNFVKPIKNFYDLTHSEKILVFAYFLEENEKNTSFTSKLISECYSLARIFPPKKC